MNLTLEIPECNMVPQDPEPEQIFATNANILSCRCGIQSTIFIQKILLKKKFYKIAPKP